MPGYTLPGFTAYMRANDADLLIIPMIETVEALEHVDEICAIEQVKVLVFASGELGFAMGEGTNMHSPKVQAAQKTVHAAAQRHGVAVIGGPMLNPTKEGCAQAFDDGISMLCLGLDVIAFRQLCENTVASANAAVEENDTYNRPPAPPSGFPTSY